MAEPFNFAAKGEADVAEHKSCEKDNMKDEDFERLKSRRCALGDRSSSFAGDYSDIEEEKGDGFAYDSDIPSQSAPGITGSSEEPEMIESKALATAVTSKKRKAIPQEEIQESRISDKSSTESRSKKHTVSGMAVCRTPSVNGLTIPFRTIKKAMKLDPDIPIVQNEAAIMTTVAVELFLKRLVVKSNQNAKNRGRNTVRYEDVAEARTADKTLSFLEPLLP